MHSSHVRAASHIIRVMEHHLLTVDFTSLFGVFAAQLYYYFLTFSKDHPVLKSFVYLVGWVIALIAVTGARSKLMLADRLLETSHTVCCIIVLYVYLIDHFGDAANGVDRITWSVVNRYSAN